MIPGCKVGRFVLAVLLAVLLIGGRAAAFAWLPAPVATMSAAVDDCPHSRGANQQDGQRSDHTMAPHPCPLQVSVSLSTAVVVALPVGFLAAEFPMTAAAAPRLPGGGPEPPPPKSPLAV